MEDLRKRAEALDWYHSLELAPGVETAGIFDLRPVVGRYGLPERMDGMRALDVGTWDGFWAFEMERRGADVVALDLDDMRDLDWPAARRPAEFPDTPRGQGFRLAREAIGSKVARVNLSVYDARPANLGAFDLVMCASVLIHLRDPVLAIERIADLCKPGGTFVSVEGFYRLLGTAPLPLARYRALRASSVVFWEPSIRAWQRMLETGGFSRVDRIRRFKLRSAAGYSVHHVVHHAHR